MSAIDSTQTITHAEPLKGNIISGKNRTLLIALEIIFAIAVMGISITYARLYEFQLIQYVGITLGIGLLALALATALCMRKKPTSLEIQKQKDEDQALLEPEELSGSDVKKSQVKVPIGEKSILPPDPIQKLKEEEALAEIERLSLAAQNKPTLVEGSIAVINPRTAGPLGKNIEFLHDLDRHTAKIKRVDGKEWKNFPNEMLITCKVFVDAEKNVPLSDKNDCTLYLPFCLFVREDNYENWKTEGETIEFLYDDIRYELSFRQINQEWPSAKLFNACLTNFYETRGHSLLPAVQKKDGTFDDDKTQYISPIDQQRHLKAKEAAANLKQEFNKRFPDTYTLEFPVEPEYDLDLNHRELSCLLSGVAKSNISYFISDRSFAIYATRWTERRQVAVGMHGIDVDPKEFREHWPQEFLVLLDFNEHFTRSMIEKVEPTIYQDTGKVVYKLRSAS